MRTTNIDKLIKGQVSLDLIDEKGDCKWKMRD